MHRGSFFSSYNLLQWRTVVRPVQIHPYDVSTPNNHPFNSSISQLSQTTYKHILWVWTWSTRIRNWPAEPAIGVVGQSLKLYQQHEVPLAWLRLESKVPSCFPWPRRCTHALNLRTIIEEEKIYALVYFSSTSPRRHRVWVAIYHNCPHHLAFQRRRAAISPWIARHRTPCILRGHAVVAQTHRRIYRAITWDPCPLTIHSTTSAIVVAHPTVHASAGIGRPGWSIGVVLNNFAGVIVKLAAYIWSI
jgi:hypothetical protein